MRLHAVMEIENLSGITERVVDFFLCPHIERAFGSLTVTGIGDPGYRAVGILRGKEPTFVRSHVPSDIIEDVPRDCFVLLVPRDLESVEISDSELRLVVEHLLKVRYVPIPIDGIAVKSAADMIMHSTRRHFAQREQRHIERVFAGIALGIAGIESRKKSESGRARKFRRIPETAFLRIMTAIELLIGGIQN